jgi:hypothetical protein
VASLPATRIRATYGAEGYFDFGFGSTQTSK